MQDRRTQILDAALVVLAQQGLAQLTHRGTDEAAGLPQGSTTYYFKKKSDLVEGAASRLAEILDDDCAEVKRHFADLIAANKRDEAIDYVADDLLKFASEQSDLLMARFELTLAGARDPNLRHVADKLAEAAREPIAFFLRLLSGDLREDQVESCMGILDGLSLIYATGQGPLPTKEQIRRLFLTV
ncbi:MAG: TetR family transcriptional regulator [Pseudomonadota bacterium]